MAEKQLLQQNGVKTECITIAVNNNQNANSTQNEKITNQDKFREAMNETPPPDGGTRAWCVMVSAFLCNSILFGIINTCGTIYLQLQKELTSNGDSEASSKAALVGSLTIGTTFFLSPISGILTDKIGLRTTTLVGGILTTSGMFISSIYYDQITALYFTYGIMFGFGAALAYTPTIAILGHYFKRYLGIVSGFVTSGSSLFTVILPIPLKHLLDNYGLNVTFCVLGGLSSIIIICAMIYKPLQLPPPPPIRKPGQTAMKNVIKSFIYLDNWKRRRYVIWALSIPVALIGYFAPYVHLAKHVKDTFPDYDENAPIMCIGITSGIGRLFFGYIADYKWVNRILLQQISFVLMGLFIMAIPLTASYYTLLGISLGIGIVDGCFISLLGPIAYDLCGPEGATQAIGFLLGLCSIPLTVGPPVAGLLYDQTKSYTTSFILAGIPSIIGAIIMSLIHRLKDDSQESKDQEHGEVSLAKQAWNEESKPLNGNVTNGHCAKSATTEVECDETGIHENVGLLNNKKLSELVMDSRSYFNKNPFQRKRRYIYGEL